MHVLVIMTDMTNYCEPLREVSAARRRFQDVEAIQVTLYLNPLNPPTNVQDAWLEKKGSLTQIPISLCRKMTSPTPSLT